MSTDNAMLADFEAWYNAEFPPEPGMTVPLNNKIHPYHKGQFNDRTNYLYEGWKACHASIMERLRSDEAVDALQTAISDAPEVYFMLRAIDKSKYEVCYRADPEAAGGKVVATRKHPEAAAHHSRILQAQYVAEALIAMLGGEG